MIVNRLDKSYQQQSHRPNVNWLGGDWLLIDETTEEGKLLAKKVISYAPYMELVIENGELVDVIELERPPEPPPELTETELLRDYVLDVDYRLIMMELGL